MSRLLSCPTSSVPAAATASSSHVTPQPQDAYLRAVCKAQAWIRGIRARRVLCIQDSVPLAGITPDVPAPRRSDSIHSLRARSQARQLARERRASNAAAAAAMSASVSPPAVRPLHPSPPLTAAGMQQQQQQQQQPQPRPTVSLRTQASTPNLESSKRSAVGSGAVGPAALRPVQPQPIVIPSRSSHSLGRVAAGGSGRSSPSPPTTISAADALSQQLGPGELDLDLESAAETCSASSGGSVALPAAAGATGATQQPSHTLSLVSHGAVCVAAADARLAAMRRAGTPPRSLPAASMSVAQLLEEKKQLRRELALAREKHQPMSPMQQRGALTSTTAGPRSITVGARGARARSASPSPGQRGSGSGSDAAGAAGSAPAVGPGLLCECCIAGGVDVDWRVIYQPLLLQFKLVNQALRAKGVLTTHMPADGGHQAHTGTAAAQHTSGAVTAPLSQVSSVGMGRSSSSGTLLGHSAMNAGKQRLAPLTSGQVSTSSLLHGASSQPTSATSSGQQAITIARSRGVRKSTGPASTTATTAAGCAMPSLPGSGGSSSTPVSRAGSRSSSPTVYSSQQSILPTALLPGTLVAPSSSGAHASQPAAASSGGATGGVAAPNTQFTQWSLQSQRELHQAQQPKGAPVPAAVPAPAAAFVTPGVSFIPLQHPSGVLPTAGGSLPTPGPTVLRVKPKVAGSIGTAAKR